MVKARPSNLGSPSAAAVRASQPVRSVLQRTCACGSHTGADQCDECRKKRAGRVQRAATSAARLSGVPPIVHEVLGAPGRPLDPAARAFMEPRFGHDFSRVRVHDDPRAGESARAVNALAYAVGQDVAFDRGRYSPATSAGKHLLAHELAHVIQQQGVATALQPELVVGPAHDPAEAEAESLAERVVSGASPTRPVKSAGAEPVAVLRRAPSTPQGVGEDQTRKVTLPAETRDNETVKMHVLRTFLPCPCRNVPDTRTGIFYDPDLNNLAIAYRRCRGGSTVDVYGQLQSNASSFLSGGAPPVGTARIGIDVNVVGRKVGARVVLEALGTNADAGDGVGGRAQIVFQGGRWRVYLEPQFIRRLGESSGGQTLNELQLSLGGAIGDVTFRVDFNDLLDPTARRVSGTICIPAGGVDLCPFLETQPGGGVTGGLRLDVPLGGPEVRPEKCFQCLCPAPVRKYQCIEDILPREEPVLVPVEVTREEEFRYYFRLDRTAPSEDQSLRTQSAARLDALAARVRAGGTVSFIVGYASPEASERHNSNLSQARAEQLRALVQSRVGAEVTLPPPSSGGELLGRRPTPSPSSRLGDVIAGSGFRSAEDLSAFLLGEEVPRPELGQQFVSLFRALPDPVDRLAVFGLTSSDAIAPQVLAAVDQFLRTGGRGSRPWERVFRLLRVGVVRAAHTAIEKHPETIHHPGSLRSFGDTECDPFAARAEATGEFGLVDENARRPTTSSEDSNTDCLSEPLRADLDRGCKYDLPRGLRRGADAPSVAPRRLR